MGVVIWATTHHYCDEEVPGPDRFLALERSDRSRAAIGSSWAILLCTSGKCGSRVKTASNGGERFLVDGHIHIHIVEVVPGFKVLRIEGNGPFYAPRTHVDSALTS